MKGTVFRAAGERKTQPVRLDDDLFICDHTMFTYDAIFTCNDVFYGAVLAFINMAAVFSLSASELSDQLLLLPLPLVRWRLKRRKRIIVFNHFSLFVFS